VMLACVEDGVVGEVSRGVRLIKRDQTDEVLFRHGLQSVVEALLFSQSRDGVGGKMFSAERACTVCRIDKSLIGKRHELVVQRIEEIAAKLLRRPAKRGAQIGTAYIDDE